MATPHGDARDLLRAASVALDWRKCWLGAAAVLAIAIGLELLVSGSSLGRWHLYQVPWVAMSADVDPVARVFTWVWLISGGLWTLLVLAYYGGAIARLAAIELTTGQRGRLDQGRRYARRRLRAFFYGPIGALVVVGLFCVPGLLAGLLGRVGWIGPPLAAVAAPLVLASTLLATLLLLGALAGWGLMFAAVAIEESDSFDAISRALFYLFDRPWHALGYRLVVWLCGAFAYAVVLSIGAAAWVGSEWLISLTMGAQLEQLTTLPHAIVTGRPLPPLTLAGVTYTGVAAAYIAALLGVGLSYAYSSAVAEYLLLRQQVDGTSPTEMQLDEPVEPPGELSFDPLLLDDEPGWESTSEDQRVAGAHR